MDVFGLRSTELDALYDWDENGLEVCVENVLGLSENYKCKYYCDLVKTNEAKTLFTYTDDFYKGMAALTCNEYGKGKAYYVATDAEKSFFNDLYKSIVKEAKIPVVMENVPDGVEVTTRSGEMADYIFIQNFARNNVTIEIPEGCEVLYGTLDKEMIPLETKVLKWKR